MPSIFISVDDLISILWFITREQFYAISQVNGLFDELSDKLLERYPQKQVDLLRIKAVESNENGQEKQQQLIGNQLFIQRRSDDGQLMDEREIPFAMNLNEYPKIGTIHLIEIKTPLQENALKFLQGCKQNFHENRRELYFSYFDDFVDFHMPEQLSTFSKIFQGLYAVHLTLLPNELDAFAEFLNKTGCRNIEITEIEESDVEPFVEWLARNPLKQFYRLFLTDDEPIPVNPIFKFKFFEKNVPKLLARKCRQAFNNACKKREKNATIKFKFNENNLLAKKCRQVFNNARKNGNAPTSMCQHYNLHLCHDDDYSNLLLPITERFRMRNRNNGDVFLYTNRGNKYASIVCKPKRRIPQLTLRSMEATNILVYDFDDGDEEEDEDKEK